MPDEYFSDTSLLDLMDDAQPQPHPSPVTTEQSHDNIRLVRQDDQPRLTADEAMAKAGSIVPVRDKRGAFVAANGGGGVAHPNGTYAPFVIAALAAIAGGMYAGWWGAGAGALGVGALVNANRWRKSSPATKSQDGLFALATVGGAVYAGYRAHKYRQTKSSTQSSEPDILELEDEEEDEEPVEKNSRKPAPRAWLKQV